MSRQKIKDGGSIDGRADNSEKEMVKTQQWVDDIISLKVGMKNKKIYQRKVY